MEFYFFAFAFFKKKIFKNAPFSTYAYSKKRAPSNSTLNT